MENNDWVTRQMVFLDPPAAWRPDADGALRRFHVRRRLFRRWPAWVAAAAAVAALVLLLPAARVAAQQLWQLLAVPKVAFIPVHRWPKGAPFPQIKIGGVPIPPIPARDVDQVRQRVGYDPRLPRAGVLSGTPKLSTTFSVSAGAVVHVADLQSALRQAGVTDQGVPAQWDNAQLSLRTSAVAIAEWPQLVLVQSLPLTLSAPTGFDFPAFSALLLRIFGVGPQEAQQFAQQMGTAPAWLVPLTPDFEERATVESVSLSSGPATVVRDGDRVTVIWSVPDRVYVLDGKASRELAIAAANAVQ